MFVTKFKQTENEACNRVVGKYSKYSVDVVNHALERKFVYFSIDTRFAMIAVRLRLNAPRYLIRESDAENSHDLLLLQQHK